MPIEKASETNGAAPPRPPPMTTTAIADEGNSQCWYARTGPTYSTFLATAAAAAAASTTDWQLSASHMPGVYKSFHIKKTSLLILPIYFPFQEFGAVARIELLICCQTISIQMLIWELDVPPKIMGWA